MCSVDYFVSFERIFCFDEDRQIHYLNEELSPHVVEVEHQTYNPSWTTVLLDSMQHGFDSIGSLWSHTAGRRWGQVKLYSTWVEAMYGTVKSPVTESYEISCQFSVSSALAMKIRSQPPAYLQYLPDITRLDSRLRAGMPKKVTGPGLLSHANRSTMMLASRHVNHES